MLPFWSMSVVISLNHFNHFRESWTQADIITARSQEIHFCKPVAIKTEPNTGVSIQANKLDLPTSYVARLQHRSGICAIATIAVTTATIALWLKHRMKHISSRGPYLSSRKAANSASLLRPYKSCSSLHLKWRSDIYPSFFSGSVQFFVFTLLFFVTFLSSSCWHGQ